MEIKEKLKKLRKEKEILIDKRNYYNNKLNNYKDLENRSKCPCCEQKINLEYFKKEIPIIEKKLTRIKEELDPIIKKIIQLNITIQKINSEEQKKHKKQIIDYIQQNKNKLNKCIRDYNKGIENYLPNIIESEKKIWNKAMEYHIDSRNIIENDELYFEIK